MEIACRNGGTKRDGYDHLGQELDYWRFYSQDLSPTCVATCWVAIVFGRRKVRVVWPPRPSQAQRRATLHREAIHHGGA